jgi:hypothetical protein
MRDHEIHTVRGIRYLMFLPAEPVPAPDVVVHNHAPPSSPLNSNNFRAWLAEPSDLIEPCACDWAPHLGAHYRVVKAWR